MSNKNYIANLNIPEEVLSSGIGITESGATITVQEYFQSILDNRKSLDPDILEIINKHFWDILA